MYKRTIKMTRALIVYRDGKVLEASLPGALTDRQLMKKIRSPFSKVFVKYVGIEGKSLDLVAVPRVDDIVSVAVVSCFRLKLSTTPERLIEASYQEEVK